MRDEDKSKEQLIEELRELRAQQKAPRLNAMLRAFDGFIYVCSRDYRVQFMNELLIERTGHDGTGRLCYEVLHGRASACPWCVNERVFRGETLRWELKSPKDNKWFYIVNTPIYNEDGTVYKQSMMLDITDRKLMEEQLLKAHCNLERAVEEGTAELSAKNRQLREEIEERRLTEEALRESEEKYRTVVDNIGIGVSIIGPNMEIITLNKQMKKWFPTADDSQRPVCYKSFNEPPSESICSYSPTYKTLQDGNVYEAVTETHTGQEIRNFRVVSTPVKDRDGKVVSAIEMVEDITESKRMQDRLLESEAKYRTIFETTACATMIVEDDTTISLVNSEFEKLTGYQREEIEGKKSWTEFVREDDLPKLEAYRRLRRTDPDGHPRKYEFQTTDRTGRSSSVFATAAKLPGTAQTVVSLLDITALKEAEKKLKRANEYLENVFENSPDSIAIVDNKGKLIKWNRMVAEYFGHPGEILKGKSAFDLYANKAELGKTLKELRSKGTLKKHAADMKKSDGSVGTFEISMSLLKGDDNKPLGSVCVARDITERRLAENLTRARLNLLEYAASHSLDELLTKTLDEVGMLTESPIGFYHFMEDDQKTLSLQAFSTQTEKNFCKAKGKGTHYPVDEAGVWADCLRERKPLVHNDYLALPHRKGMPEGHAAVMRELVAPIMRSEKIVAVLGIGNKPACYTEDDVEVVSYIADVAWEIVERKRTQEELDKYRDRLEDLVEERTDELARANERLTREIEVRKTTEEALQESSRKFKLFAYSVVHDLKSPTIGIHGLTKLLHRQCRDAIDEKGKAYCDQILKASEHIASLVQKINHYIAAKESRLLIEKIDLKEIFQMLREEFSAQLIMRQIAWSEPDDVIVIRADRLSLLRSLRNLIDNALKYGGEKLSRICIEYDESDGLHILSVSDNGRGLSGDDAEGVFRPFERHDTSKGIEGAGLGLTIVKEIAEQHGGKVWIKSGTGQGVKFYISFSNSL